MASRVAGRQYPMMAFFAKYHATMLFVWAVNFLAANFFVEGGILRNLSLGVGIILALLTIFSKCWELFRKYRRQTLREEIQRIIRNRELDGDTEDVLRNIANDQ
jgi:hypothetical protein